MRCKGCGEEIKVPAAFGPEGAFHPSCLTLRRLEDRQKQGKVIRFPDRRGEVAAARAGGEYAQG